MNQWKPVIYASDCVPCDCCEEAFCQVCNEHYADCDCIGPCEGEDEVEYNEEHTMGRRL